MGVLNIAHSSSMEPNSCVRLELSIQECSIAHSSNTEPKTCVLLQS